MNDAKIKQSDVATLRAAKLLDQGGVCPCCNMFLLESDAALDHDHKSGRIRAVIHRDCNILLGKVENFVGRYGKRMVTERRLAGFLDGAWDYMQKNYDDNPLHYKHKTPEDKLRLKYKRLLRRSKKPETKAKYRKLLEKLP